MKQFGDIFMMISLAKLILNQLGNPMSRPEVGFIAKGFGAFEQI